MKAGVGMILGNGSGICFPHTRAHGPPMEPELVEVSDSLKTPYIESGFSKGMGRVFSGTQSSFECRYSFYII